MVLALLLGTLWTNQLQQPFPQRLKVTAFLRPVYIVSHLSVLSGVVSAGWGEGKGRGGVGGGGDGGQGTKSSDLREQINERDCLRG